MRDSVEYGWGVPKMREQFPFLSESAASRFDIHHHAIIVCHINGYMSDKQRDSALRKLTKRLESEMKSQDSG